VAKLTDQAKKSFRKNKVTATEEGIQEYVDAELAKVVDKRDC
jgi:hypothetical protein